MWNYRGIGGGVIWSNKGEGEEREIEKGRKERGEEGGDEVVKQRRRKGNKKRKEQGWEGRRG